MSAIPRGRAAVMLGLTFVTGIVDAVGYLGLDRVFVGNMTGNVVILAMALTGSAELPVLGPSVALVMFALGAFTAGLALRHRPAGWTPVITRLLGTGAAVLGLLAVAAAATDVGNRPETRFLVAGPAAAVLGVQAVVARKVAVSDLAGVVVTSTLTSWAGETLVAGGRGALWNRRPAALGTMFAGALLGAGLVRLGAAVPMALAGVLMAGVAVGGHLGGEPRPT